MSYATVAQALDRWPPDITTHLDADVSTLLDSASQEMDAWSGRRPMASRTVTEERVFPRQGRTSTRQLHLPDYPVRRPDLWGLTLTSIAVYDNQFTQQSTVSTPDSSCEKAPEMWGLIVLPAANPVYDDDWFALCTYTAGYTSVPADLMEACVLWAESHLRTSLGIGGREEIVPGAFARSRAEHLLQPWRKVAVA